MDLEIVVRKETREIAEVILQGRAGLETTDYLGTRLNELMDDGYRHILLNLKRVRFIDSAGLGALVRARHGLAKRSGSLRLIHPSPAVARALELTQLRSAFSTYDSVHEAVAALVAL